MWPFEEVEKYRVTKEWAIQLAYMLELKLDYGTVDVFYVSPGGHEYRVMDKIEPSVMVIGALAYPQPIGVTTIYLDQKVIDPINGDVTWLGYNTQRNALIVGMTYKYHKVK